MSDTENDTSKVPEKLIELLEQLSISAHGNGLDLEDIKATPEEEKNMGDRGVESAIRDIVDYIKSVADEKIKESYNEGCEFAKQDARRAWREKIEELKKEIVDLRSEIEDLENMGKEIET